MRYAVSILILLAVCAVPTFLVQGRAQIVDGGVDKQQKSAKKEKPLRLQKEAPLLLLEDDTDADLADTSGADNSRCLVCHLNLGMEQLAVTHAKQDIGCADCHGECDDHIDDESWASGGTGTPPDIMFPARKIDPACAKCHDSHDAPAAKVLQAWRERCPKKTDFSTIVCTDCHGKHRLIPKLRKAWWDKETGKPIKPKIDSQYSTKLEES
jgi:hypothetical protein